MSDDHDDEQPQPEDPELQRALEESEEDPLAAARRVRDARGGASAAGWKAEDHFLAGELLLDGAWVSRHHRDLVTALELARGSAESFLAAGDVDEAAGARLLAGDLALGAGSPGEAADEYDLARRLSIDAGDAKQAARCLARLGNVRLREGDVEGAIVSFSAARDASAEAGDTQGQAVALRALAEAWSGAGRFDAALRDAEAALALARDAGDSRGEARALDTLGELRARAGDLDRALQDWERARGMYMDAWDRNSEAETCRHAAVVVARAGDPRGAEALVEEALRIHGLTPDLAALGTDLLDLVRLTAAASDTSLARLRLDAAVEFARRRGASEEDVAALRAPFQLDAGEQDGSPPTGSDPGAEAVVCETSLLVAEAEESLVAFRDHLARLATVLADGGLHDGAAAALVLSERAHEAMHAVDDEATALHRRLAALLDEAGASEALSAMRTRSDHEIEDARIEAVETLRARR